MGKAGRFNVASVAMAAIYSANTLALALSVGRPAIEVFRDDFPFHRLLELNGHPSALRCRSLE